MATVMMLPIDSTPPLAIALGTQVPPSFKMKHALSQITMWLYLMLYWMRVWIDTCMSYDCLGNNDLLLDCFLQQNGMTIVAASGCGFYQEGVLVLDHSMVCRVGNCYWKTCIVEQKSHELGAYANVRRHTDAMLIYSVSLQVQQMLYIRRALMIIADIEVYTQGTHNSSGSWYHVAVRSNLLYATYLIKWRISCKMKCTWAWQSPGLGGPWVVRRISEGIVKHVKKKYR